MKLVLDPHGAEQIVKRGIDFSMLLEKTLQIELSALPFGKKIIKKSGLTTLVFKKSNRSNTIYIKTAWAKYKPANRVDSESEAIHA